MLEEPEIPTGVFNPGDYPRTYRTSLAHWRRHAMISFAGLAIVIGWLIKGDVTSWDIIVRENLEWQLVLLGIVIALPILSSMMARVTLYADRIKYRHFLFPMSMLRENIEGIHIVYNRISKDKLDDETAIMFMPVYKTHKPLRLPLVFEKDEAFVNWIYSLPLISTNLKSPQPQGL